MELILTIIGSGAFGSSITYFLFFRKNQAEAKGAELENVADALKIWRETNDELKAQVTELREEVKHLNQLVSQLHHENKELKKQLTTFK